MGTWNEPTKRDFRPMGVARSLWFPLAKTVFLDSYSLMLPGQNLAPSIDCKTVPVFVLDNGAECQANARGLGRASVTQPFSKWRKGGCVTLALPRPRAFARLSSAKRLKALFCSLHHQCLPASQSSAGPSSKEPSLENVSSEGSSKQTGPKCGACGNIGHNKNSKKCPLYYSLESRLKREVSV